MTGLDRRLTALEQLAKEVRTRPVRRMVADLAREWRLTPQEEAEALDEALAETDQLADAGEGSRCRQASAQAVTGVLFRVQASPQSGALHDPGDVAIREPGRADTLVLVNASEDRAVLLAEEVQPRSQGAYRARGSVF